TLRKFNDTREMLSRLDLKVNNNNVSHSERLGVIRQNEEKTFNLTELGNLLRMKKISFNDLFVNQMLIYFQKLKERMFFPYRLALIILHHTGSMNYIEFLYGVYSLNAEKSDEIAIAEIVDRITWIRESFPNISLTSQANQESV